MDSKYLHAVLVYFMNVEITVFLQVNSQERKAIVKRKEKKKKSLLKLIKKGLPI